MGKYATNPEVMTKDIGVTPAASPSLAQPRTTTPGNTSVTRSPGVLDALLSPAPASAAPAPVAGGVPTGCVPAPGSRILAKVEALKKNLTLWTDPATGTRYLCPKSTAPGGTVTDPNDPGAATEGAGLGEYGWPPELKAIYDAMISRGGEFLNQPGYSPESLNYMFGQDFEKIRGQEASTRQQILDQQSRSGTLGSGSALQQLIDNAWGTEGNVANTMKDIFVQNEGMKRADVNQGTGIFNTATEFAKALEAINSGRRGEGSMAMQQLLALLQILKG